LKIGTSLVELDSAKILKEDEDELVLPGILAREGVFPYPEGRAFRPRKELENSLITFEGAAIVGRKHPETLILTDPDSIIGKVSCANLDGNGAVHGEVHIYKKMISDDLLAGIKSGVLTKTSIGFLYVEDATKGEFNGQPYDYVQRKIKVDHVAVGVPFPRDPGCVLGVDDFSREIKIGLDPWEETGDYIRSGHKEPSDTCRTITLSEDQGIKAIYCKYGDNWDIQSYLFAKAKDWSMEKAKSWFSQHKDAADAMWETAKINDLPDSCFAYIEGGGKKDEEGKTVPRSLRHLPYKDSQGQIDHGHLVNALARVSQSATLPEGGKSAAKEKLCSAVRSWNNSHPDSKVDSAICGTTGDCVLIALSEIERSKGLVS
jgi:hypothetical protein